MGRYLPKLISNKNTIIKIVLNKNNLLFFYFFIITNKKMKLTSFIVFGIKENVFYCDEIDHVKMEKCKPSWPAHFSRKIKSLTVKPMLRISMEIPA